MPAPRTCQWPNSTTLFSIGFNRLSLIEVSCQTARFVVCDRTE